MLIIQTKGHTCRARSNYRLSQHRKQRVIHVVLEATKGCRNIGNKDTQ